MNKLSKKIDVSICMITYGHELYFSKAIESVLFQNINFEIEIIISNDNSPDNTDTVIQKYLANEKYQGLIHYTKHPANIGAIPNFVYALSQCQGKYIAICEGDDYWLDENKLQSQFDYMESNPDYVSCGSQVKSIYGLDDTIYYPNDKPYSKGRTYSYTDLALANRIPFVTAFFRNNLTPYQLDIIKTSPHGDWPTHIAVSENESSLYFVSDRVTSAYRLHDGGIYSLQKKEVKNINTARTLSILNELTSLKFESYYYLLSIFLMKNWNGAKNYLSENYSNLEGKLAIENNPDELIIFIAEFSKIISSQYNFAIHSYMVNKLYKKHYDKKLIYNLYMETKPNKLCLLIPNQINFNYWKNKQLDFI